MGQTDLCFVTGPSPVSPQPTPALHLPTLSLDFRSCSGARLNDGKFDAPLLAMISIHRSTAELEGTAYFELLPGAYGGHCWGPNSLFFSEEVFGFVEPIFAQLCPEYDHYAFTEIGQPLWRDILKELDALATLLGSGPSDAALSSRLGFFFPETERKFFESRNESILQLRQMIGELVTWLRGQLEKHDVISVLGL